MRKLYNITIKSDNFLDLVNKIIVRRSEVIYHGQKRNIKRKSLSVFYAQLPKTISKCWWYPGMASFSSPTRIRNFISIRGNNWFPDRPSCHRLTDSSHIFECEECGLTCQLGGCWHIGGQLGLAMATISVVWLQCPIQYCRAPLWRGGRCPVTVVTIKVVTVTTHFMTVLHDHITWRQYAQYLPWCPHHGSALR